MNATSPTVVAATAPGTRALLTCGMIAGPLFVVAALLQASTRDGFDVKRHPISMLSLGDLGWIQVANFVISGLLFVICAVGLRRVLHPGRAGTWGPLLIAAFGLSLIAGGVFPADPALGFPPGAPEGPPPNMSPAGIVHGLSFAVGMSSLIASFFVFARRFGGVGERGWVWYCLLSGLLFVSITAFGMAKQDFRIMAVAIVIGWGWTALIAAKLRGGLPRQSERL
jgi:Protein of unknown function (DUF998)